MNPQDAFDARIAAIYGLGKPQRAEHHPVDTPSDMRHAEFQARADVFLGEGYDREKLNKVENCQVKLRQQQASLIGRYDAGELIAVQYVRAYNSLLLATFAECEKILGQEDFVKFFGASPPELSGFIDEETFVAAERENHV